jgi:peptidoglycan/LPS O-acetylase OafA/YrhL
VSAIPELKASHGYRPDVDGLRAVAVISVVAYHGFPAWLPGGFVGVDIFFVISGFLITGIILDDLVRGTFTFADFYSRRVRRIFPALILVLLASFLGGLIFLLPDEFAQLGRHIASGALFVSNVTLYREVGYFDTSAELKPLLHLWSLAVEEQYYAVWPVLLVLLRRRLARGWLLVAAIALASFALNVAFVQKQPSAVFYLPLTRFWELMIGGALAYGLRRAGPPTPRPDGFVARHERELRNGASAVGAMLLAIAFTTIDTGKGFPGTLALLPTLGAALIVFAGPQAWINRFLSLRAMVWVGVISYPLYLWHWPLLAFGRILTVRLSPEATFALIGASVVLAWLTYRYVEVRFRFRHEAKQRTRAVRTAVVAMVLMGSGGLLSSKTVIEPTSAMSSLAEETELAVSDWQGTVNARVPGASPRTVLFFGDSHMQQYAPRFVGGGQAQKNPAKTIEFFTLGGCAPMPGIERRGMACADFVRRGFERAAADDIDTVVIASSWLGLLSRTDVRPADRPGGPPLELLAAENQWVFDGFEAEVRKLVARGKHVVIVLSSPRGETLNPRRLIERTVTGIRHRDLPPLTLAAFKATVAGMDERIAAIATRAGAQLIDPSRLLCTTICPAVDAQGNFIYVDDSHLRASFVRDRFTMLDSLVMAEAGNR